MISSLSSSSSPSLSKINNNNEKVILVIGTCLLDRLLHVPTYPKPDEKVRCTSTHIYGGGNGANTASALARLSSAKAFLPPTNTNHNTDTSSSSITNHGSDENRKPIIRIKLITKVGCDPIQSQICSELTAYNVDISSPLFLIAPGTTSATSTVIVSQEDGKDPTRTCFFDPGSCGEITPDDMGAVTMRQTWNDLFQNVIHVHSDSRHTYAALLLAKEAISRGIPFSLGVEKDRTIDQDEAETRKENKRSYLDELIGCSDVVFTNEFQMECILDRKRKEYNHGGDADCDDPSVWLPPPTISMEDTAITTENGEHCLEYYSRSAVLCRLLSSALFSDIPTFKEVVVTRGSKGSIHIKMSKHKKLSANHNFDNYTQQSPSQSKTENRTSRISNHMKFSFGTVQNQITIQQSVTRTIDEEQFYLAEYGSSTNNSSPSSPCESQQNLHSNKSQRQIIIEENEYIIQIAGPPHIPKMVDTTGAGDVFVAGYILSSIALGTNTPSKRIRNDIDDATQIDSGKYRCEVIAKCLKVASWVAGRKIAGPGARCAVPTGEEVDSYLGRSFFS